jgi:hypothetical protein
MLLWLGATVRDEIEAGRAVESGLSVKGRELALPWIEERSSGFIQGLLKNRPCSNHQHTLVFVVVVEERGSGGRNGQESLGAGRCCGGRDTTHATTHSTTHLPFLSDAVGADDLLGK